MVRYWLSAAALAVCMTGSALATPITYVASLSGANESPPNASPGAGFAKVIIDTVAHTFYIDVTFTGLTGTTTAAHIHCCTAVPGSGNVGVATSTPTFPGFPSGVTAGSYVTIPDLDLTQASSYNGAFVSANGGIAGAEAALAAGLAAGTAYFNLHTDTFGSGEIRGFLAVPEPATVALLGLGVAVAVRRRRRKT